MVIGNTAKWLLRCSSSAAIALFVSAGTGCEDKYPNDLAYPPRSDLLVVKVPTEQPTYPDSPGQLDHFIALINANQGETLDPKTLPVKQRQELNQELVKAFGSPAHPKVSDFDDEDAGAAVSDLDLDAAKLAKGSHYYRRNCLHCHGLTGDGRGPSGAWLNPHPRDYRQGQFKFMSSTGGETRKPRRTDLKRILANGIESTSMPAFNVLSDDDLESLVSYVMHLSIRGEVEFNTLRAVLKQEELKDDSIAGNVEFWTKAYLQRWKTSNADSGQIKPGSTPSLDDQKWQDSVNRGYALFTDPKGAASCIGCHSDYGRQVNFRYDVWGTLVRPANLTAGVYRGGRRPIDLFWRIKGGIVPSGMPAASSLKDEEVWDIVNFLQALPHSRMLPPDIRGRIYVRGLEVAAR